MRSPGLRVVILLTLFSRSGRRRGHGHAWPSPRRGADVSAIRTLLEQKADVNAPGRDGTPALHWLVRVDDLESSRLLIRAGADATRPIDTA